MARGFRLRDAQRFMNVAHADLARQQQAEDSQPGRVPERLKQPLHRRQFPVHRFALTNISQATYDLYTLTRIQETLPWLKRTFRTPFAKSTAQSQTPSARRAAAARPPRAGAA